MYVRARARVCGVLWLHYLVLPLIETTCGLQGRQLMCLATLPPSHASHIIKPHDTLQYLDHHMF